MMEAQPMNWGPVLLCCWPGLPGLWFRGRWSSLMLALIFSIVLNLAIISTFIWTGIFVDETFTAFAWPVIFSVWAAAAWIAFQTLPDVMSVKSRVGQTVLDSSDALFLDARGEYLRGHWDAAEQLLLKQLSQTPRDVESRLLLATLYRHTRKFDNAWRQLETLEMFDESQTWQPEIQRERKLLELIIDHENSPLDQQTENSKTNNDGFVRIKKINRQGKVLAVEKSN
jgi:hypothetical protein